ncbi:MAG: hypothetical protein MUC62_02195 [Candidatus Thermoplasmatota archaeon]|jgi:chromosome segregation ATPase|nr:hypothetical protein [Candidatus Thermoplasmatota archaeon]
MILPKGSLDVTMKGGPSTIDEMIGQIKRGKVTGYILVLGTLADQDGKPGEMTGQLVFKEGAPILCEATHQNAPIKGKTSITTLLKAMTVTGNTVELHSKIDVGPPLAFFKECKVLESDLDLKAFKDSFRKEEEERKRMEEERKLREEFRKKVSSEVQSWTRSGFKFTSYPAVMDKDHKVLEAWFKDMTAAMEKCRTLMRWAEAITDPDLEEPKGKLLSLVTSPEEVTGIEKARETLKARSDEINEKRREMKRWVDGLREEGYNTKRMEEALKGDISTAWNNLTQFMDDIQMLKDHKDELERIAKEDRKKGFSKEITDIEFLLNDPMEIGAISQKLSELKALIENEKRAKEDLLEEAAQLKAKGFDLSGLKKHLEMRLEKFKVEFNLYVNNAYRIGLMKQELSNMDRRDLSDEIDAQKAGMTDPFDLGNYEKTLNVLKKRLDDITKQRGDLQSELDALGKKGYLIDDIRRSADLPLEKFDESLTAFRSKVKELEGLSAQINDMDHRWLEKEFEELSSWLHDTSNISRIKQRIKDLRETIDKREKERGRVRSDAAAWEKEGFNIRHLKEALEDSLQRFTEAHKDTSERIKKARDLLKKLSVLDARFFVQEASDLRAKIMDPLLADNAAKTLESLKQDVEKDRRSRDSYAQWLKELSKGHWNVDGLDKVLKSAPTELEGSVNDMKRKVGRLKEALDDVERWDQLESNWLAKELDGLKKGIMKVEGGERSLQLYEELKEKIAQNKQSRDSIRKQLEKWKDEGYITKNAHEKLDSDISALVPCYEDLKVRIERLENVQRAFDKLDFKHFRSQAEEIEFKLNDPYLVEQLEKEVDSLKERIDADRKKRQAYGERIKGYVSQGFMGAKKLIKVMEEDISIVDLEFRNFDKEVDTFKKLLASTGYVFVQDRKQDQIAPPEKEKNELSEALDNLMQELSDKQ